MVNIQNFLDSFKTYGNGIGAINLGNASRSNNEFIPDLSHVTFSPYNSNRNYKPLTIGEHFLREKMGYSIGDKRKEGGKILSRFSSSNVQTQLKKCSLDIPEDDMLRNIVQINDYCNLNHTTAKTLPRLKEVGGNLTINASSKLEDLSKIKRVGGLLNVVASSIENMNEFLKKIGMMNKNNEIIPIIEKGVKFLKK